MSESEPPPPGWPASPQGYGPPPAQGYGPPAHGYGPPPQGYGPPVPGYGPPSGYGPPPGVRPPARRGGTGWIVAIVVVVLLVGASVGYRLFRNHKDHSIDPDDRKIASLEVGDCFIPSGSGVDDKAIRAIDSCNHPEASVRVTKIVKGYGGCFEGEGNGFLAVGEQDGVSTQKSVCLTANLVVGHCYQQDGSPTFIGVVSCDDAHNATTRIAVKRVYNTQDTTACGSELTAFVAPDENLVTCLKFA